MINAQQHITHVLLCLHDAVIIDTSHVSHLDYQTTISKTKWALLLHYTP